MEKRKLQEASAGSGNNSYIAYTDGAYSSARDQGGIGIVILKDGKPILEHSKMYKHTTNNRMELGAIIIALRAIIKPIDSFTIYSDSMYCIGCITLGWKRKKNQILWKVFEKEFNIAKDLCPDIQFKYIKGHENNKWNNYVDRLAVLASQQL